MARSTGFPALFTTACLASACQSKPAPPAPPAPPSAAGIWGTEGYGFVVAVGADTLKAFEVTKLSCIPSFTARKVAAPAGALGAFTMVEAPITFLVLPDSGADRGRLHMNGAASDMVVHRLERKPAVCDQPTPNTPPSNFAVFVENWAEHYPFFADKKADWSAIVAANRAKVTDQTTPEELFTVLQGMVAPLEDAHTFIVAPALKKQWGGSRKTASSLARADRPRAYGLLAKYAKSPLHQFCEGQLEFGMVAADIGYLRIRSFGGYTKDGAFETGLVALEAALDTVFAQAGTWKGFVLDVRLNGGGADPYGIAIAGRLAGAEYQAYFKQARSDPADPSKWTAEQPSIVKPGTRPGFKGAVVELIGVQSVSAAETFTQALLRREPKVTRVGENTQGVFSDVLGRHLPNGWQFGLPNERFVTDGKSYDGPGIPPDVPVESFTPAALKTGRDAGLDQALELLGGVRANGK